MSQSKPSNSRLPATEDHRSRRDDQLVDLPRRQRLPDNVGAATHGDITVAGRLGERRVEVADEPEPGLRRRLVRGAVGQYEQGPRETRSYSRISIASGGWNVRAHASRSDRLIGGSSLARA